MSSSVYTSNQGALIGITFAFSFLVLVDLIGNILVIAIIVINRTMRTSMNYLLVNIAVADMMVGVFIAPGYIFSPFFIHSDGFVGTMVCKFLTGGNFMWMGASVSVLLLVAVSYERYFDVVHQKLKLTVKKVKIIAVFSWFLAAVSIFLEFLVMVYDQKSSSCIESWLKFPGWMPKAYGLYWLLVYGILPVLTMVILYSGVIYKLWFKQEVEGTQLAVLRSRKRITKMVITISIIYGVSWLPNLTIYALVHFHPEYQFNDVTYISTVVLAMCNSAIKPVIYVLLSEKFRRHMWEIVSCKRFRNNNVSVEDNSTKRLQRYQDKSENNTVNKSV